MLMLGSTLGSDNFLVWIADDLLVGGTARLGETSMTPSCARTLCLALLLLPLPLAAQKPLPENVRIYDCAGA